jgi:hypothetical protein
MSGSDEDDLIIAAIKDKDCPSLSRNLSSDSSDGSVVSSLSSGNNSPRSCDSVMSERRLRIEEKKRLKIEKKRLKRKEGLDSDEENRKSFDSDEGRSHRSENSVNSRGTYSSKDTLNSLVSLNTSQEQCIFMIKTMLKVFPEKKAEDGPQAPDFYVSDDYENQDQDDEINEIKFYVFNNYPEKEKVCLMFSFFPDPDENEIYIERALTSKCGDVTGTDLLNKMGMVFLLLKDKYPKVKMEIRLDEAEITSLRIERSLTWLYLFKSGESWYNSKGYKEDNYVENKELMDNFIKKKVKDEYTTEQDLGLIIPILETLSVSDEESIKDLFTKICDILKTPEGSAKPCECIKLLNLTIKKFEEYLEKKGNNFMCTKFYSLDYNPEEDIERHLRSLIDQLPSLEIEEKGGRKTRKRRGNKRKNTRKRNKKSTKKRKGKKAIKRRTKKNKRNRK